MERWFFDRVTLVLGVLSNGHVEFELSIFFLQKNAFFPKNEFPLEELGQGQKFSFFQNQHQKLSYKRRCIQLSSSIFCILFFYADMITLSELMEHSIYAHLDIACMFQRVKLS